MRQEINLIISKMLLSLKDMFRLEHKPSSVQLQSYSLNESQYKSSQNENCLNDRMK